MTLILSQHFTDCVLIGIAMLDEKKFKFGILPGLCMMNVRFMSTKQDCDMNVDAHIARSLC